MKHRGLFLLQLGFTLLVGAFLIGNTFSIVVTQRTHELAVLRATGATGRQVLGSVLGEALLIGLVAAGLGIGFVPELGLKFPSARMVTLRGAAGLPLTRRITALTRNAMASSPLVRAVLGELR